MFQNIVLNLRANANGLGSWYNNTRRLNQQMQNLNRDANRTATGIARMSMSFGTLNKVIGMGKFIMLGNVFANAIQSAIDMTETVNLFNISLGDTAVKTNEVVQKMSTLYGLDSTNLQNAIGTFGLLARSMGMSTNQASTLSTNMGKLAVDLSSLTNVPVNQVMQDLRSGLVGQSETVYKYGMDVTEAGIKTEAMNQGITKSVREMGQGEKMALRYSAMIRQSGLAQGDFAATINSPANQLKILHERFISLGRAIGSMFIPFLTAILPYVNAVVTVLTVLINRLSALLGFEAPKVSDSFKSAIGGMGEDADDTTDSIDETTKSVKKLKNAVMGFDELNIMPQDSSAGKDKGKGGGSILPSFDMPSYDNMMDKIKPLTAEIEKRLWDIVAKIAETGKAMYPYAVDVYNFLNKLGQGLLSVAQRLKEPVISALNYIRPEAVRLMDDLVGMFGILGDMGVPLADWFNNQFIPVLMSFIAYSGMLFADWMNSCKMVFDTLVYRVIIPDLDALITGGLPLISDFARKGIEVTFMFFEGCKTIFDRLWKEGAQPTFILLNNVILDFGAIIKNLWDTYANPVFTSLSSLFTNTVGTILNVWDTMLKPMWNNFMDTIDWLWEKHFKPLIANLGSLVGEFLLCASAISNNFFLPIYNYLVEHFGPAFSLIFNTIVNVVGTAIGFIVDLISSIITVMKGVLSTLTGVLTGDWKKAFDGMNTITQGFTDMGAAAFKGMVNVIIDVLNFGLGAIEMFVNGAMKSVNKLIDGINDVSGFVGFGDAIGHVGTVSLGRIPKLARGGMLDGGSLFEAGENGKAEMIGSFNNRTTVMPLENTDFVTAMASAVYGAVTSAMNQGSGSGDLVLRVNDTDLGRVAIDSINKITKQEGRLALNL